MTAQPIGFTLPPSPHVGFGQVHHARVRPARHQFTYANWFLWLPMRTRQAPAPTGWQRNRAGPVSFYDEDHGRGTPAAQGGAMPWLLDLLAAQGIPDGGGDVWLQTYPRVWGYGFRPVSFWFCFQEGSDSDLAAVVAEVNNTFGERHCYVLRAPQWGQTVQADKAFHVSPFCQVEGHYDFCFSRKPGAAGPRIHARIDYHDNEGLLIHTHIRGQLKVLDPAALRQALWGYPLMTLAVMWRIHLQALRLWRKRVPFFRKPPAPALPATNGRAI
jgi:uncharacterized protein